MSALQVRGLSVGYGNVPVVHEVDLTVAVGEAVCLVGPNGAGKSTALRGIVGLTTPTAGSISWDCTEFAGRPAHSRAHAGIALVPEGRHVFPQLTVGENLEVAVRAVRGRGLGARVAAAFDRFPRLRERRTQPAGLLSGGEQQMLAIARALVQEPRMLLIDEMSLGLAPVVYEQVGEVLRELTAEGIGVLMVEQNAALAMALCSRGYLMSGGRVLLAGTTAEMAHADDVGRLYFGAA